MLRSLWRMARCLPAEWAHRLALWSAKVFHLCRGHSIRPYIHVPAQPVTVWGRTFLHPVGLAAGFDKNGEAIDALAQWGFSFIEVGAITPLPQPGNPMPRLFRIPAHQAVINRMGFNNHGLEACVASLKKKRSSVMVGVNLGRQKQTSVEKAADDYVTGLTAVYPYADFVTINVSSPNTPGLRELQGIQYLTPLLQTLKEKQKELRSATQRYVPVLVKVSPDLSDRDIQDMADVFISVGVDGVIATNTSIDHSVLGDQDKGCVGGLSGAPLFPLALRVFQQFRRALPDDIPMIASGGVMSRSHIDTYLASGAALVQVYTGLIYEGPTFWVP